MILPMIMALILGQLLLLRRQQQKNPETLSDEALVAACATGDTAALGLLFDRFHLAVYDGLGRYLGRDYADLDDLVQTTFLEAQRAAAGFSGRAKVRTWLLGIAMNVARKHRCKEGRRHQILRRFAPRGAESPPRPDACAENQQAVNQLLALMANLPDEVRTAFTLCYVDKVPGAEVAQILGMREGTLWRRLHEARKKLRSALEGGESS